MDGWMNSNGGGGGDGGDDGDDEGYLSTVNYYKRKP